LSIIGPEDTTTTPIDSLDERPELLDRHIVISGATQMTSAGFQGNLKVEFPGGGEESRQVRASALSQFISQCVLACMEALERKADSSLTEKWKTGRPRSVADILDFARLLVAAADADRHRKAEQMWEANTQFVLPLHLLDSQREGATRTYLRGL